MAAESRLADAVRVIINLATAQVRKDTPSLIDVKGLGRPKEFTGREENFQQWLKRTIISPGRCSFLELQAGIERRESYVSRYERKLKDKLDDEIKLAGPEALVPEELEKHLIRNSNRMRTFGEVVTYVEAKFGLRHRDSKPSDTGSRGHSDLMVVDAVNSLSLVRQRKRVIESA